ncbi:radical SAM protein [Accumulibacter sp.]|uniref:radical SAM protein n=1 Tax=Accumulibacter sp. TaxID=2053492 RepID=UPI0025D0D8A2|nr:radical SAM protein [Accumulibacter sp.]MCM8596491.1 radical SAM protein [Accumulibacter sp.]MCM8627337.1 radical SAM protein [Accumulibacter sp.]MDS4050639.1 radical SAM protein [Accumulibacter sp.]
MSTKPSALPAYRALLASGELTSRAEQAWQRLEDCDLCARHCRVNRRETLAGVACHSGERAVVASYGAHHGEEECLSGWAGSGTIFFSWCNLRCVYCQNWDISQRGSGREVDPAELARIMLSLQAQGCHNINLVSPSHVVAQIIAAVALAANDGLRLPLVYNTGGYDSLEALALLAGIIDIYMPDMQYGDPLLARRYSRVRDHVAVNRAAVKAMHRQVGDLVVDESGLARRGLLVRHLVLPNGISGTGEVLRFVADELSRNTYLNLMDQYRPCYRADDFPELSRPLSSDEYREALAMAEANGLRRLDRRSRRARFAD